MPGKKYQNSLLSRGKTMEQSAHPAARPLIFNRKDRQCDNDEQHAWKNRQEQTDSAQNQQGPTGDDKRETLHHSLLDASTE
jgi:hypothetical protein